jgi:hypothetical protein
MKPKDLIQYHDNGWRAGYVLEIKGDKVRIQPIGAYKGVSPRPITVEKSSISQPDARKGHSR